jgi:hypothetical protein
MRLKSHPDSHRRVNADLGQNLGELFSALGVLRTSYAPHLDPQKLDLIPRAKMERIQIFLLQNSCWDLGHAPRKLR